MTREPRSILLVEDDIAHAEITRRNLTEFDDAIRELVHVMDGQAAIDYLNDAAADRLPDIVLLDLRLPRVDGLEVLSHIRGSAALRHIPVVVLTTSKATADVREAYQQGASGYLVKPVEYEQFVALTRAFGVFWLRFNRYADA